MSTSTHKFDKLTGTGDQLMATETMDAKTGEIPFVRDTDKPLDFGGSATGDFDDVSGSEEGDFSAEINLETDRWLVLRSEHVNSNGLIKLRIFWRDVNATGAWTAGEADITMKAQGKKHTTEIPALKNTSWYVSRREVLRTYGMKSVKLQIINVSGGKCSVWAAGAA